MDLALATADERDLTDTVDRLDLPADHLVRELGGLANRLLRAERDEEHRRGAGIELGLFGDVGLDLSCGGAGKARRDDDDRDVDVREVVEAELAVAHGSEDDEGEPQHRREDGAPDRDASLAPSLRKVAIRPRRPCFSLARDYDEGS